MWKLQRLSSETCLTVKITKKLYSILQVQKLLYKNVLLVICFVKSQEIEIQYLLLRNNLAKGHDELSLRRSLL